MTCVTVSDARLVTVMWGKLVLRFWWKLVHGQALVNVEDKRDLRFAGGKSENKCFLLEAKDKPCYYCGSLWLFLGRLCEL